MTDTVMPETSRTGRQLSLLLAVLLGVAGCSSDEGASGAADTSEASAVDILSGADSQQLADSGTPDTGSSDTAAAETTGDGTNGLRDDWGPGLCPPTGAEPGYQVGQRLADLPMKDCDGNEVTPADLCGADGLWLLAAHGWCPHCKKAAGLAEPLLQSYRAAGSDLAAVVVLVETGSYQPPTAADCKAFRAAQGHEDVVTLYAPMTTMQVLWEQNFTALSIFASASQVLTGKVHTDVEATLRDAIDTALGL